MRVADSLLTMHEEESNVFKKFSVYTNTFPLLFTLRDDLHIQYATPRHSFSREYCLRLRASARLLHGFQHVNGAWELHFHWQRLA